MGTHKQIKETQMNTQNTNLGRIHKKHTRLNRAVWTGPGSCAHGKRPVYSLNAREHFKFSPLLFSWQALRNRCQMQLNKKGGMNRGISDVTFEHKLPW